MRRCIRRNPEGPLGLVPPGIISLYLVIPKPIDHMMTEVGAIRESLLTYDRDTLSFITSVPPSHTIEDAITPIFCALIPNTFGV
jgi:hypothetical protein